MHLVKKIDYRQPEASTTFFPGNGTIGLLKCLEDLPLIGFRDARASIRHSHREGTVRGCCPYLHLADLGELDGVAEQVQEHLRQAPLIALAAWEIVRQRNR